MGRNYKDVGGDKNPNYKTGLAANGKKTSLYRSWQGMKQRCLNQNHPKYHRYGGRGVKVCDEWLDIRGFSNWAFQNGWKNGMSIDRVDNDGDYCPENCRWVSVSENSKKKSTSKLTFDQAQEIRNRIDSGESEYELASEYGVVHGTIWFIKNRFTHLPSGEIPKKKSK